MYGDRDVENTKERPALKTTRRYVGSNSSRQEPPAQDYGSNERRWPSAEQDSNRSERNEQYGRTRSAKAQRSGRRDARAVRRTAPEPKPRRGVPLVVVIILLVISIVASVLITRGVMQSKVDEAKKEAEVAKSQVTTLTEQLSAKSEEVKNGTAKSSESSSSNSSSSSSSKSSSSEDSSKKESSTEGVESPWTESGTFTSGDSVLDSEVKAFCDSVANKSTMDFDTAMYNVYTGIAWSDYVERDSAQNPAGTNWRIEYARQYYENSCSGNCYEFASFLGYCMQYMGYTDAKAEKVIMELQSGGWGDHGIVFVTNMDGEKCLCDTARGTDGWMLSASAYNYEIKDVTNA